MSALPDRYHRSTLLFGAAGQLALRRTAVTVIGVGGLGSALVQHLALLGVKSVTCVDNEELDETSRNRFIGARATDPVPGSAKVDLADRMIREINPDVGSNPLRCQLVSPDAFTAVKQADWVFGCLDDDGPRAILNELCAAYDKPYVDLASDVPESGVYGGRVCVSGFGSGCLNCLDVLDPRAVRRYVESPEQRRQEDKIYGVDRGALETKGPSVSSLNGVIASLAATEFMVAVTRMRPPKGHQEYRGHMSTVTVVTDTTGSGCYVCDEVRGKRDEADVERYLRLPHLAPRPHTNENVG